MHDKFAILLHIQDNPETMDQLLVTQAFAGSEQACIVFYMKGMDSNGILGMNSLICVE